MGRPHIKRCVEYNPGVSYFKPRGIPMDQLEEIRLKIDEREALRLADFEGLSQEEAGKRMGVSRATFGRIVERARRIVADALINGKAIHVEGGNYAISSRKGLLECSKCGYEWHEKREAEQSVKCPSCNTKDAKPSK
jgi:predicted DNA-binding protein (UPF0251 family)